MEKKKKVLRILARVLAIVTALVCTLCMVIPSYADDTLTEQGTIIAEQAEKIETYISTLGYGNLQLTAGEQLEIQQLTYEDVGSYSWYDSTKQMRGLVQYTSSTTTQPVGATFTIYDEAGEVVYNSPWSYYSNTTCSHSSTNIAFTFVMQHTGQIKATLRYDKSTGYMTSVVLTPVGNSAGAVTYNMSDGYVFKGASWVPSQKVNLINGFAYLTINPSQLLALNVSASNEEVYNQGFETGLREGYDVGYGVGLEDGWESGHTEGYTNGLDQGYRDGYDDGMTQMSLIDLITEIIRAPMTLIESTLNFDIFGINLSNAVKALVSMALLAVVITIVWKAVK